MKEKTFGIGITLVIALLIAIAVFSFLQTQKVNGVTSRLDYTRNVLIQLSDLYNTTILHASAARNYSFYGKTGDIGEMQSTAADLLTRLNKLKDLVAKDPGKKTGTDSLTKYINRRIDFSKQIIAAGKEKGHTAAFEMYQSGVGRDFNNMIHSFIQKMQADELSTLQVEEQKNAGGIAKINKYLFVLLAGILILIFILVQKIRADIATRKTAEHTLQNFNQQLREQVKEKAAELTGVFERITDGFIALDKNFCFTYVNRKAAEMTNREPASFIGKNMWKEFDKSISPMFRNAIIKAMEQQEYIHFEEFSPAYDRWFEDHIYPSPEGVSIFYRDITSKKKTELALKSSEETTALIMNAALDAIVCMDTAGIIIVWTSQAEKIFGWPGNEVMGKKLADIIIPGKYREQHWKGIAHYLQTGDGPILNKLVEVPALHREGHEFPIELSIVPIKKNGTEFFCSFIRDISERKKAEEAVRKSEERYKAIIEQASDAIMITDQKGNFLDVNTSFCTQFGYTKEELMGLSIANVIDPDQLQSDPVRFDLLIAGETISRERKMMHRNGRIIEVEVNVKMLPDGRMLAIARDITERKKIAEEILKEKNLSDSVINSMPGIFYFYDQTGKFIRWNKRYETVTGFSAEEISKMHPLDFFEGEDKEIIKKCIADVFENGFANVEAKLLSKNKTTTPYYFTSSSIEIDSTLYSLGTGMDLTERKKAEEELRISRERLERSYEQIRLLASNIENIREEEKIKIAREIHDELGQQLTGLKMDVSWLSKKLDPNEKILQEKVKDIMLLLDDTVRSVRRIASDLRPGLLDDLGLVAAIEWQSEEFEKRSGIKVQFAHALENETVPAHLSTGLFRIYQESLTNVARHAQAQNIIVSLYEVKDEILLKISDDGKGFDAKEIENKRTLGLLGMKERSTMMGGKYEIISKPGKGTTVIVSVPLNSVKVEH